MSNLLTVGGGGGGGGGNDNMSFVDFIKRRASVSAKKTSDATSPRVSRNFDEENLTEAKDEERALVLFPVSVPSAERQIQVEVAGDTTVQEVISSVASQTNQEETESNLGLCWKKYVQEPRFLIWLVPTRSVESYGLDSDSVVELRVKEPEALVVRVVVPELELVGQLEYNQFITVGEILETLCKEHGLNYSSDADESSLSYRLYSSNDSSWLERAETLASYCLKLQDTLECKLFYPDATPGSSVRRQSGILKIHINQSSHTTVRQIQVPLTTTVGEVISMVLRKTAVDDPSQYGLYLVGRDDLKPPRPGTWLEDYKFLASFPFFPLQAQDKLEFRNKYQIFTFDIRLHRPLDIAGKGPMARKVSLDAESSDSSARGVALGMAASLDSQVQVTADSRVTVGDAVDFLTSTLSLDDTFLYGISFYDLKLLPRGETLWSLGNKDAFVFYMRPRHVKGLLSGTPDSSFVFSADFSARTAAIHSIMCRKYGIRDRSLYHIARACSGLEAAQRGEGLVRLLPHLTLHEQGVMPDSLIVVVPNNEELKVEKHTEANDDSPLERLARSHSRPNEGLEDGDVETSISIWDEPPDFEGNIEYETKNGAKMLTAATLNKLVEKLTDTATHDMVFVKTFLLTYQSFTTPEHLLFKLVERYNVVRPADMSMPTFWKKLQLPIQLRVGNAMKLWIEASPENEEKTKELQYSFAYFIKRVYCLDHPSLARTVIRLLYAQPQDQLKIAADANAGRPGFSVFDEYSVEEIARQLCLVEFKGFMSIKPAELLNQAWSKEKYHHKAPNLLKMIKRTNEIGLWVATVILSDKDPRKRAKFYTDFIQLAAALCAVNNFSSLMAVLGGLSNSAVLRLKHTKKLIRKEDLKTLSDLEKLMSPESNFRNYRSKLHQVDPPCVPYLGVYLSDLTFLDDGNPDKVRGLINFSKRKLNYTVIADLQTYQDSPYKDVAPIPELMRTLMSIMPLSDKAIYGVSLKREPRE